ncbi:MAG: TIGR03546 family protein [Treponema sp.]|nr:TIGR03546 family protein [Treponema sp.]
MLKPIIKLLKALNGNLKKESIAAGFAWGLLLGLLPAGNFFWIVLFVVSFFFNHHHWSKILFMVVIKLFLGLLNPAVDAAGWEILHLQALQPAFTSLYNMPLVPLTGFNNTLVAGGLCIGIILWLPVYFIFRLLVPLYRNRFLPLIRESKVYKAVLKFPLFPVIEKAVKAVSAGQ